MTTQHSQGFCTRWNRFRRDSLYVTVSAAEANAERKIAIYKQLALQNEEVAVREMDAAIKDREATASLNTDLQDQSAVFENPTCCSSPNRRDDVYSFT